MQTLLSEFGILPEHWRDKRYLTAIIVLVALAVFLSVKDMKNTGGDFVVFWWAGKNFIDGNDLYSNIGGAERYIYPPFTAMWFQAFALNTIETAGAWWRFANFGLFAMAAVLVRKIYLYYYTDTKLLNWALVLSILLSFRYFWYHHLYIQMNELIFVLSLYGILSYLRGNETAAVVFFTIGAFVKVLPVFFLMWLVSKGSWRTVLKIMLVAAVCVALPMLFRGVEQGWTDHLRYYTTFLEPFKNGRVEPEFRNYSLPSLIYNWCQPTVNEPMGLDYRLFNCTLAQTKLLHKTLTFSFLGLLFGILLYARFVYRKTTFWEISYIFLCMNLLPGICWEYHIVPLQFVLIPLLFVALQRSAALIHRIVLYFLLMLTLFMDVAGTDTVGVTNFHYIGGYGILNLLLLALALYTAQQFFRNPSFPQR